MKQTPITPVQAARNAGRFTRVEAISPRFHFVLTFSKDEKGDTACEKFLRRIKDLDNSPKKEDVLFNQKHKKQITRFEKYNVDAKRRNALPSKLKVIPVLALRPITKLSIKITSVNDFAL